MIRARTGAVLFAAAALLLLGAASGGARAQPSLTGAPADLFYLHPLVNYSIPVRWQAEWERARLARGGLQVSAGSISTKDLATQLRIEVNEPVTPHLRFVYRLDWVESPHVDGGGRQDWIGVEVGGWATPGGRIGVDVVVNPASDKEDLDLATGLVWTGDDRRDYLRLEWRRDDLVWEGKNDLGGVQESAAAGPAWTAHFGRGAWEFSTEGAALAADERRFPDADRSPEVERTRHERSWSSSAVRFARGRSLLELRFEHRDHEAQVVARDDADGGLDDASRWRHLRLAWEQEYGARWRTRAQVHHLSYHDDPDGYRHRRDEALFGAFVEREVGWDNWIDVGFLGSLHEWSTAPDGGPYGDDRDAFASKLSLGWTLEIAGRGFLRALLSHEPDPGDFGGGSVMAQLTF